MNENNFVLGALIIVAIITIGAMAKGGIAVVSFMFLLSFSTAVGLFVVSGEEFSISNIELLFQLTLFIYTLGLFFILLPFLFKDEENC